MKAERARQIIAVNQQVPKGRWTSYADMSEVIYGHRHAASTVRDLLRDEGDARSAHRTLTADGHASEESVRRLRDEGTWDEASGRARPDRYVDAETLRHLVQPRLRRR